MLNQLSIFFREVLLEIAKLHFTFTYFTFPQNPFFVLKDSEMSRKNTNSFPSKYIFDEGRFGNIRMLLRRFPVGTTEGGSELIKRNMHSYFQLCQPGRGAGGTEASSQGFFGIHSETHFPRQRVGPGITPPTPIPHPSPSPRPPLKYLRGGCRVQTFRECSSSKFCGK